MAPKTLEACCSLDESEGISLAVGSSNEAGLPAVDSLNYTGALPGQKSPMAGKEVAAGEGPANVSMTYLPDDWDWDFSESLDDLAVYCGGGKCDAGGCVPGSAADDDYDDFSGVAAAITAASSVFV